MPMLRVSGLLSGRGSGRILIIAFFVAGVIGLVLEVAWFRSLSLVLGSHTQALTIVLAAYMAGLVLGNILIGRWIASGEHSVHTLVRTYAILLGVLGISGPAVIFLAPGLAVVAAPLLRLLGWNSPGAILLRGLVGLLLMSVPTIVLGGLWPLVAQLIARRVDKAARSLGVLYFLNTLGSVAGALLCGFFLLEHLGVKGTVLLAGAISLCLSLMVWFWPVRLSAASSFSRSRLEVRGTERLKYARGAQMVLLVGFGLSGFAALGLEVLWTRALVTVMGQPVYGATLVLTAFLLGLALGGLAAGTFADRVRDPLLGFGIVECGIGITSILALVMLARAPAVLSGLTGWAWPGLLWGLAGFCFGVMVLPTMLMGGTFPLASKVYLPQMTVMGQRVGVLFAVNTVGALLGALATGFLLVPALGTVRANLLLAGVGLGVGAVAIAAAGVRSYAKVLIIVGVTVLSALAGAFLVPHRLRILPLDLVANEDEYWRVLYYRESVEGVVTTAEDPQGIRQTWVNSSVVCGNALPALKPVRLMGVLPMVLHPAPRDALVIGYGLGVTSSLLVDLGCDLVDCVEIAPAVVAASEWFAAWNNRVFDNPVLRVMAGDGRNYLLCTTRQYDIISCDPTHPALGSVGLYTREFYQLCLARLRSGGVITQYVPFHKLEERDFLALVNTFRAAFPNCALWRGIAHGVLVGRKDSALALDWQRIQKTVVGAPRVVREALTEVFLERPEALVGGMVLDSAGIARLTRGVAVLTDDQPRVEFVGARASDTRTWVGNARLVLECYTGPGNVVLPANDTAVAQAVSKAGVAERARFLATLAAVEGQLRQQREYFLQALRADPEDREAQLFLRMSR